MAKSLRSRLRISRPNYFVSTPSPGPDDPRNRSRVCVRFAVILDAHSRKVVRWELDQTLATRLPLNALLRAIGKRKPGSGVVHQSDRGVQYASGDYVGVLRNAR